MKELGVKCVVVRADREKQVKFLKKIGADDVIHTEMDMDTGRPCGFLRGMCSSAMK